MKKKMSKKTVLIVVGIVLLLSITIGTALLSSILTIQGNTTIKENSWIIYFDSVRKSTDSVASENDARITNYEKTRIEFSANLKDPGDFYEFTVYTVNDGTIDAMVDSVEKFQLTEEQLKYLEFNVTYDNGREIKRCDPLDAHTRKRIKAVVKFKEGVDAADYSGEDVNLDLFFNINYVQKDDACPPVIVGNEKLLTIRPHGGKYKNRTDETRVYLEPGTNYTLEDPTRYLYNFDGWEVISPEENGTYALEDGVFTMGDEDVIIEAKWIEGAFVARIMNTYYPSIQEAFDHVDDGWDNNTVYLLKNQTENSINNATSPFVFDLGGNKVTGQIVNPKTGNIRLVNGRIEAKEEQNEAFINYGIVTLGTQGGGVQVENSIAIVGNEVGLRNIKSDGNVGEFYFYDGYIEAVAALVGGYTDKETDYYIFSEHMTDRNDQRVYLVRNPNRAVAKTTTDGIIYYYNLQDAINQASINKKKGNLSDDDYIISAVRNFEAAYKLKVQEEETIIFDLDGHTVSTGDTLTNDGNLTIKNTAQTAATIKPSRTYTNTSNLTISNVSIKSSTDETTINNSGSLSLTKTYIEAKAGYGINNTGNGTISLDKNTIINSQNNYAINNTASNLVLNNGTIYGINNTGNITLTGNVKPTSNTTSIAIYNGGIVNINGIEVTDLNVNNFLYSEGGATTITDSKIINTGVVTNIYSGTLELNNVELKSINSNAITGAYGSATLNSGKVESSATSAISIQTFTINDGTVTGIGTGAYATTLNVNGGTISSDGTGASASTANITGGTITGVTTGLNTYNAIMTGGTINATDGTGIVSTTSNISNGTVNGTEYGIRTDNIEMTGGNVKATTGIGVLLNNNGTITGGTITGETYGLDAKNKLTLGNNDGTISSTTPVIIGNLYGLYIEGNDINFYDGILKGQTDGYYGKITGLPTGGLVVDGTETIDEVLYQTDTVNSFKNWLQVGEEQFNNIDDACAAIENTGTITVIDDADIRFIQNFTKNDTTDRNITFDLNGHSITTTQPIYNHTNVTIVDNSNEKNGRITTTRVNGLVNSRDGTLTINSGEYLSTVTDYYGIENNGVMVINAAHVAGPTAGMRNTYSLTINDIQIDESPIGIRNNEGTVIFNGGNIEATDTGINKEYGYVEVNGGSIYGTNYGIGGSNGSASVTGGNVRAKNYYALYSYSGDLSVSGGTVISEENIGMLSNSTMYVEGGYVEGIQGIQNEQYCTWYSCWYNNIEVSGGHIVGRDENGINAKGDSSGQLIITGGTVEGKTNGVTTTAKTRLGSDNGLVSTTTPVLIGHTNYGITHSNYTEFYDGILKGIQDGRYGLVSIIPDGYLIKDDYEYIDRVEYQTDYLVEKGNWLRVGNKEFNSINKAKQYITEDNRTMTVIADAYVDFAQTINASYDVIFDFNGHSLVMTQPITVNTNTKFINSRNVGGVNNLRDNAVVVNGNANVVIAGGIYHSDTTTAVVNQGNLTVNDGEIKSSLNYALTSYNVLTVNGGLISGEDQASGVSASGVFTMNGGTIQSQNQTGLSASGQVTVNNGTIASGKGIALNAVDSTLTINNGLIKSDESTAISTSNSYYGTQNTIINNGEIIGNTYGIQSGHYQGSLTVNAGHIVGETITGIHAYSTSYINGGNIEGGQYGINATNGGTVTQIGNNDGTINIDAPIIKGDLYGLYISDSSTVNFYDGIIKGITGRHYGVITSIASHAQIFEDEEVINEQTYYTEYLVTETEIVINEDTGVTYGNLQTAITQAQEGETLRLLTNVPLYYEIDVSNHPNITLNMDGKTISTNKRWRVTVPFTLTNTSEIESTLKISTAVNLIETSSDLTINNVTLKNTSSSNNIINNSGRLTLNNVQINCINGVQSSYELNITNSTINATKTTISNTGKLTITGGTYNGSNYSLYSNSSRPVNISNATFNGVFYNSGSNTATLDDSTIHGNLQNNTSNLTVTRTNIDTGRVTNNGTMTMIDSTFAATTIGYDYYYYQDVAMANSGTLTLDHSNVMINREDVGKSSVAISNTSELNVTNNSKVFIGIDNSGYYYYAISTTGNGLTTITNSEVKATGGYTNYALYTEGANAKTVLLTGIATAENATTGYGAYIDKGTFEMGHYEGQGVTSEDVSISNPMVYSVGKSRGIGVKKINASFNFYDGIIRASKYAKPETTTNVEYQFEVTTYVENDTGYEYAILEWMRNDYQGDTVCLLNDVYYKSVQDAIDKAEAGDEITLLRSVEEDFTVPTNKNIKLNLNQHSITTQVTNNGTFNVYNGSLQNFEKTTIINRGTLILGENDNNVSSSNIRIVSETTTIQSTGNITMYDGYIEGQQAIDGKINQIAQYARIRTVTDEQSEKKFIQSLSPEAIMNGDTDLIITVDPNSGVYEGSNNIKEIFKKYQETYTLSEPTKRGCIFTGWEISDDANFDSTTNTITVDISDVTATAQWEVSPNAIAKIGDEYYLSLQEALDNATDGQVVELLKDTTEDITNRANVKLDLGGFTVTGAFINQGELRLVNGTVENPSGVGMINQKQLIMGENDGTVHEESVKVIGTTVGLQQDAIFKFYDGFIEGDIALNGRVDAVPSGYFLYNDRNNIKNCQRVYLIGNPANAVAVIENGGTQYFFSLQSAIDTATITGDEIYIVRDFEAAYPVSVNENANITINMSGYNITTGNTIVNNGTLKIYDTSEPIGSITSAKAIQNNGNLTIEKVKITQNTSANAIENDGTLNIVNTTIEAQSGYAVKTSGPVTMDTNSKITGTGGYALYNSYDNLVLNAGEINGIYNANTLTLSDDVYINSTVSNAACVHTTETNAKLTMNGGRCDAANIGISMQGMSETFEMNGGKITSNSHALYVVNGSASNTTTITDGELETVNTHTIYIYGLGHNLTIDDAKVTSQRYTALYMESWSSYDPYRYNVTINGGTFKGADYGAVFHFTNLDINGGTFETTSTNRDRYAIWKYYGNNATINDATLIANNASGMYVRGSATLEDTTITVNGVSSYGIGMEDGNLTVNDGTVINTTGSSSIGISMPNYSGETINFNGGEINSANMGIDTSGYNATKNININSGTITGETYGINVACPNATVTIGQLEGDLSITDPVVSGGLYGVYKTTGTTNLYSGAVRGYIYGYNDDFNSIRKSKDITEEPEAISYNSEILTYSGTDVSENPIARTAKKGNGYAKITYLGETAGICTTNQEWTFDFTETEAEFTTPCTGKYKLEVWGAQGGYRSESQRGGYGGYSTGSINLTENETIYINVGGQGSTPDGGAGYNGGGYGGSYGGSGGGGGATHIATKSGLLNTLENDKDKVLIVAGAGGGFANYACSTALGGNGGGYKGSPNEWGGTQTKGGSSSGQTGGSFGQGGYQSNTYHSTPGGGAGWYGGGTDSGLCGGGGGSGYIGNSRLTEKYMYGYEVETTPTEWIRNYLVSKANFLGVNDQQFNSIESAVSYIKENLNGTGTIVLLKNATIQEASEFSEDATITFDLNGHILQATRTIVNKADLTIIDSTDDKEGMIYDKQTTVIDNQNSLHVVNGVIQSDNGNGINGYTNTGSITIDEGVTVKGITAINTTTTGYTINVTNASILGSTNGIISTGTSATITINGSTVTGTNGNGVETRANTTLTIRNSTVTAKTDAVCPQGDSNILTIEGSNIEATSSAIAFYSSSSTNNISSSTLTSYSYGLYLNAYYMTINLTNNTIKCTNGIAIHDVNGGNTQNNVTLTGGTVEATSHAIHTYHTNITTSNVTITTTANSRDYYCIYEAYNGPTITLNEGTKLVANTASGLRCTTTTIINDVEITANHNDGFGILTTDYGNLTILGGTIYGKKYGLYQNNSNATTTLGNDEESLSITTPVIEGGTYGINKEAGKINFYSGRVKGNTESYHGNFNRVRKGHKVYTFDEVIDENNPDVTRKVSYLTENEGFLQVGDDPTNIYNTFEDALASINGTEGTITVLNDNLVYEDVVIPSDKIITLNLNNHKLETTQTIVNNGTLTINGKDDLEQNLIMNNQTTDGINNKGVLNINNVYLSTNGVSIRGTTNTNPITITDSWIKGTTTIQLESAQPLTVDNSKIEASGHGIVQQARNQKTTVTNSRITASDQAIRQNADGAITEVYDSTLRGSSIGIYQYDSDAVIIVSNTSVSAGSYALYTYGYRNTITISNDSRLTASDVGLYHDINTGSDYTTINIDETEISGANYGVFIRGADFTTSNTTIKTNSTNKDYYAASCQAYSRCNFTNNTELKADNASGLYVNTYYDANISNTKINANAVSGYGVNAYDGNVNLTDSEINTEGYQSYGIYQSDYDAVVTITNTDVYSKNIAIMVGCNRGDTKKLTVNSGTILGENYGINTTCSNNTVTVGNLDDPVSITNPHVEGGLISINKTAGTLNFYSGLLKGYLRGNPGTVDNVRTGYEIFDDEDEAQFYIRSQKTISTTDHSELPISNNSKEGNGYAKISYEEFEEDENSDETLLESIGLSSSGGSSSGTTSGGTIESRTFEYRGSEETYTIPYTGFYQIETWGAQGGSITGYNGGYGGYATGKIFLEQGTVLYINVGGKGIGATGSGQTLEGGYNGGGKVTGNGGVNHINASGGGATHIATKSGELSTLENDKSSILIVSGGGGGARNQSNHEPAARWGNGGSGGGYQSSGAYSNYGTYTSTQQNTCIATQSLGYAFGQGENVTGNAAGGGGYYGGYSGSSSAPSSECGYLGSGSGGSGYIGNTELTSKHMTCFNCETSNNEQTKTLSNEDHSEVATADCSKEGDGAAKITYLGTPNVEYQYVGHEEVFVAPTAGYYQLETWGAQGGNTNEYTGGYGAYSTGKVLLSEGEELYINVGGKGQSNCINEDCQGGYNGGGASGVYRGDNKNNTAGGGGATSITKMSGLLDTFDASRENILIVASGGGGAYYHSFGASYSTNGGNGGGITGSVTPAPTGFYSTSYPAGGGTQNAGGTAGYRATAGLFGQGGYGVNGGSGGGAGFFGGGGAGHHSTGGGSGYIGNTDLTEKHMTCYNCETSDDTSTKTLSNANVSETAVSNKSKIGDGYAKITYTGGNDVSSDTHTITLNSTIGTIENNSIVYDHGDTLGNIPQPTINDNNLVFVGWYTDRQFTKRVNENTIVNMSTNLYAKFNYTNEYCSSLAGNLVTNFDYTGNEQEFTTICPGKYKLELWGAQGGNSQYNTTENIGGYGGYSIGYTHLKRDKTLYINVGGKGNSVNYNASAGTYSYDSSTGYNGGGYAVIYWNNSAHAGGGGATHIATKQGLLKDLAKSKDSVLIVAGGGGGAGTHVYLTSYSGDGGSGGGAVAGSGIPTSTTCYNYGTGGTQNSVGTYIACANDGRNYRSENLPKDASFGFGSNYTQNYTSSGYAYSGGGAGWYGGQSGYHGPGGGGSSYLSQRAIEDGAMYGYNVEEAFTENKSNIAYLIEQRELLVNLETNEKYLNLQDAIDEANNNEVLQYIANDYMGTDIEIPQGKHIIIDMNGYNITTSKQIENNGVLTIENTSEDYSSKITNNSSQVQIINNATLTLDNIKMDVYTGIENKNNGTLIVNDSNISARNIGINNSGRMTTEGAIIYGANYDIYSNSDKTELISNTTLKDTKDAYYKYNNGDTTITDSTIRATINNARSGQPLEVKDSVINGYIRNTGTTTFTNNEIKFTIGNDTNSLIYNTGILTLTGNDIEFKSTSTYGANYTNVTLENRGTATSTNNDYSLIYDYDGLGTYTYRYRTLYQVQNYGLYTSTNDEFTTTGAQYMYTFYNNSSNASVIDGATITQNHGSTESIVLYNYSGTITFRNSNAECSDSYTTYGVYNREGTANVNNVNINIHDSNGNNNNSSYGIYVNNGSVTFDMGNMTLTNVKNGYGAIVKNTGSLEFKNGSLNLSNNINSYGVYLDSANASYTQGIYDGRGTDEADVSISSPYISAIASGTGLGVRQGGGTFNYYDGYITGSSSPRQNGDITSATELNYQVSTKHDDITGYDYCILEYNK